MKKIILDFDGTLLDSSRRHSMVLADCLTKQNLHFPIDDYLSYKADGNSTKEYLVKRCGLNEEKAKKVSNDWILHIEDEKYMQADILYMDTLLFLENAKKISQLFLLSARKNCELLLDQVKKFHLDEYFKDIMCVSPQNAYKEKLQYIQKIKGQIIIGDTENEWKSALTLNIPFFVLNRGFRSKKYWKSLSVKSYESLGQIFNEMKEEKNASYYFSSGQGQTNP